MNTSTAQRHELHSVDHTRNVAESEMWWNPLAQDAAAWNTPIAEDPPLTIKEMKMRENRMHVDHVQDMVPFWIRGVEAAEKGEVLRLEHFLETLQEASDAWQRCNSENPWLHANSDQGWGEEGWGRWDNVKADAWDIKSTSSAIGSRIRSDSNSQVRQKSGRQRGQMKLRRDRNINYREKESFTNAFDFVEYIARQRSADEEQKRQMHIFFDVCQIAGSPNSWLTDIFQMPTHEKVKKIDEVVRCLHEQ